MWAGNLVGDSLLAAAFVSYVAPFTMDFRQELVVQQWIPELNQRAIPVTPNKLPLALLATDTDKVCTSSSLHEIY